MSIFTVYSVSDATSAQCLHTLLGQDYHGTTVALNEKQGYLLVRLKEYRRHFAASHGCVSSEVDSFHPLPDQITSLLEVLHLRWSEWD